MFQSQQKKKNSRTVACQIRQIGGQNHREPHSFLNDTKKGEGARFLAVVTFFLTFQ